MVIFVPFLTESFAVLKGQPVVGMNVPVTASDFPANWPDATLPEAA